MRQALFHYPIETDAASPTIPVIDSPVSPLPHHAPVLHPLWPIWPGLPIGSIGQALGYHGGNLQNPVLIFDSMPL